MKPFGHKNRVCHHKQIQYLNISYRLLLNRTLNWNWKNKLRMSCNVLSKNYELGFLEDPKRPILSYCVGNTVAK
jgi:hypothetical protein